MALPAMGVLVAQTLVGVIETYFVGLPGIEALAGKIRFEAFPSNFNGNWRRGCARDPTFPDRKTAMQDIDYQICVCCGGTKP